MYINNQLEIKKDFSETWGEENYCYVFVLDCFPALQLL